MCACCFCVCICMYELLRISTLPRLMAASQKRVDGIGHISMAGGRFTVIKAAKCRTALTTFAYS